MTDGQIQMMLSYIRNLKRSKGFAACPHIINGKEYII